jgi:hypothetical protein
MATTTCCAWHAESLLPYVKHDVSALLLRKVTKVLLVKRFVANSREAPKLWFLRICWEGANTGRTMFCCGSYKILGVILVKLNA